MGHALVHWQGVPGDLHAYLSALFCSVNSAECFSFLFLSSPLPAVGTKDLLNALSHLLVLFWGQMSALVLTRYFLVSRLKLLGPTKLQIEGKRPLCVQVSFLTGVLTFSHARCPSYLCWKFCSCFWEHKFLGSSSNQTPDPRDPVTIRSIKSPFPFIFSLTNPSNQESRTPRSECKQALLFALETLPSLYELIGSFFNVC